LSASERGGYSQCQEKAKTFTSVKTADGRGDIFVPNLVAVRVADGYEKGDKVLRPERIKIFKYEASSDDPSEK